MSEVDVPVALPGAGDDPLGAPRRFSAHLNPLALSPPLLSVSHLVSDAFVFLWQAYGGRWKMARDFLYSDKVSYIRSLARSWLGS